MDTAIITSVVGLGGWGLAITQLILSRIDRRRQLGDELLRSTLQHFDGGAQRRTIGIALAENLAASTPMAIPVLVPVLTNQIVYLLLGTTTEFTENETRNLIRLLHLTEKLGLKTEERFSDFCIEVMEALMTSARKDNSPSEKGLWMSSYTCKAWYLRLGGAKDTWDAEVDG